MTLSSFHSTRLRSLTVHLHHVSSPNYVICEIRHVSAILTTHLSPTIPSARSYKWLSGDAVVDKRKQAVSIRLGESDIRNIKRIAKRLGVRDSDIIRFAIKTTLNRIAPLCDQAIRGRNLVPVLVESGDDLIRYFELDAFRLERIINEQVEEGRQVERDDIALLAMSGLREEYLLMRIKDGIGASEDAPTPARSLRGYLYEKYVYRNAEQQHTGANGSTHGVGNDSVGPHDAGMRVPARRPM
jgi:hypothetical protein